MNKPDVISTEYMVSALANDTCATFWIYYTLEANRVFSEVNTICVTLYKALKQVTSQLWQSYIEAQAKSNIPLVILNYKMKHHLNDKVFGYLL